MGSHAGINGDNFVQRTKAQMDLQGALNDVKGIGQTGLANILNFQKEAEAKFNSNK